MITNEKVVARWALGDPSKWPAGRSRNVFFEGPTLYSWGTHFPLAHWTVGAKGQRCVLANLSERYSVSTSRHQALVKGAVARGAFPYVTVHDVPDPLASAPDAGSANLAIMVAEIETTLGNLKRARALWRRSHLTDEVDRLVVRAKVYANAFLLGRVTHPLPVQKFERGEVVLLSQPFGQPSPKPAVVVRPLGERRWEVTCPADGSTSNAHEVCLTRSN